MMDEKGGIVEDGLEKDGSRENQPNGRERLEGSRDLCEYLEWLSPRALRELYGHKERGAYACRAVLQRLSPVIRQCLLRLSVCGGQLPRALVLKWPSSKHERTLWIQTELPRLERLYIILPNSNSITNTDPAAPAAADVVQLTPEFLQGIQFSLTHLQSAPWEAITTNHLVTDDVNTSSIASKETAVDAKNRPPTLEELEVYTQDRWDSVLHFLVGSPNHEAPPEAVVAFLEQTGLMQVDPDYEEEEDEDDAPLVISSKGYEFMLQDVHQQVWQFILQYFLSLESHYKCHEIRMEALLFLLCCSFCQVGHGYPASTLSKDARVLMQDFSQFGLCQVLKLPPTHATHPGQKVFYPTRVAVHLVAGSERRTTNSTTNKSSSSTMAAPSASATRALENALNAADPRSSQTNGSKRSSRSNHIGIICQTNFQLVAYTTSELHVSMLGLFCDPINFRRLPNVVLFRMTRDSVKAAFRLGIEAQQILNFLKLHAHPKLRQLNQSSNNNQGGEPQPLVPSNVEDQIWLWDRERSRVRMDNVWIHQCRTATEFETLRQYCIDHNAYAWSSASQHRLFILYDQWKPVQAFLRQLSTPTTAITATTPTTATTTTSPTKKKRKPNYS